MVGPHSVSTHPHAHLYQPLLSCNKLHDHRQTHTDRVSSNNKNKHNITELKFNIKTLTHVIIFAFSQSLSLQQLI